MRFAKWTALLVLLFLSPAVAQTGSASCGLGCTLYTPSPGVFDIYIGNAKQADFNDTLAAKWNFQGIQAASIIVTGMATASNAIYMTGLATSAAAQVSFLCRDANNQIIADTGATCIVSSGRVKEAVDPLLDGLASVLRLVPVSFNYKKTGNVAFDSGINHKARQVGFIAEQAEAVDKRLVTYDSGGQPSGFRYESYVAVLTRAIQQQQQQIAELQRAVRRRSR